MKKQLLLLFLFIQILQSHGQSLAANITVTGLDCVSYGEVLIEASGGDGNYVYAIVASGNPISLTDFTTSNNIDNLFSGVYDVYVRDNNGETGFTELINTVTISEPELVSFTTTVNQATCFGDSSEVNISVISGSPPYTFEITDALTGNVVNTVFGTSNNYVFTNLSDGNYYIKVIDTNNCTIEDTVTIISPTQILAETILTNNSVEIQNVTGGIPPYQYSIDGGATYQPESVFENLITGVTYFSSVIDSNGCISALGPVDLIPSLTISLTSVDLLCYNDATGNISFEVNNGVGPYTYELLIDNTVLNTVTVNESIFTFSNLNAGTYTIQFTDNGTNQVDVTTIDILEPAPISSEAVLVSENSIEIQNTVGGIPPYVYSIDGGITYQNNNLFTNLSAGTYSSVVIDSNGCTFSNTSIVIDAVNNSPVAVDDYYTTVQDTAVVLSPLDSDSDLDGDTLIVISINGVDVTAGDVTIPVANGTVTVVSGVITFTPITGFSGTEVIPYIISDENGGIDTANIIIVVEEIPTLDISISTTDVSCTGELNGLIEVVLSGGIAPYRYQLTLDNGETIIDVVSEQSSYTFANLSAGQYQVKVTDNDLNSVSEWVTILEPSPLVVSYEYENLSCNGSSDGAIYLYASGGTGEYIYQLFSSGVFQSSNTFTDLVAGSYEVTVQDQNGCFTIETIVLNEPSQLIISSSGDSGNGTLSLLASGGTPPYEYSIDGGATYQVENNFENLQAGTYSYVARDSNSCFTEVTDVVIDDSNSDLDFVTLSATDLSCYGESNGLVDVVVSGGIPPFRYQLTLDNGVTIIDVVSDQSNYTFSSLSAGQYQVMITDNDFNTTSEFVTVLEPEFLELSYEYVNPTCNGSSDGVIYLYATGGAGSYVYELSDLGVSQTADTFTNLVAGSYQVTVQDANGCFQIVNIVLEEPEVVTINSVTVTSSGNLASGSISLGSVGGNTPYTYTIYLNGDEISVGDIFYDLAPGVYEIVATDANGCSSIAFSVTIVQVDIDNSVAEREDGGLDANYKEATSYQWINVDTQTRIQGATNSFFIPSEYGNYQVEITVAGSENVSGKSVYVQNEQTVLSPVIAYTSGVLGLNDVSLGAFKAYPNPADDFITVPTNLLNSKYSVYDLLGKELNKGMLTNETIDLVEYSKGIYFLKVEGYKVLKFIKK